MFERQPVPDWAGCPIERFRTSDLEEVRARLLSLLPSIVNIEPLSSDFLCDIDTLRLGGVTLIRGLGVARRLTRGQNDDWAVVASLDARVSVDFGAMQLVTDRSYAILCPPSRADCVFEAGEFLWARIDGAALKATVETIFGEEAWATVRREPRLMPFARCHFARLASAAFAAFSTPIHEPRAVPRLMALYDELMLAETAALVAGPTTQSSRLPNRAVERAIAFMEAHYGEEIGSAQVAAAAGASVRMLQYAFRTALDTTPTAFLKTIRLDKAREALSRPGCEESVTEVALACGFNHLGEFSRAYARRFGEAPSETRRRRG
ncbi:helix-turn-helix domain-containing protein [Alsobacter sp. SYSU M60028]|uniref:Helix-turn-helix domain-containing protein n=1 Tax=Alsobacter ponti TaxID=2962936 RepID=A0ABT1LI17_9HYPH|nr:helix-turn-helix domain-containing protein [Alsobacter ponti]MCP8940523.1 helix-turn-helix domain-containing protein [Alsobacter ponti]